MKEVVIVSAVRTPVGNFNGVLASVSAVDMGSVVIKEALSRVGVKPEMVDEVIMGNVIQAAGGPNPARQASLKAGLPNEVPAFTVNKLCASGLKSVALAAQSILAGDADIVVAGGMESMTNAPFLLDKARWGYRMGAGKLDDALLKDGLICAMAGYHMGITAENVAEKYGITREMQDQLAVESQHKAVTAIESGAFKSQIVPVTYKTRKGVEVVVDTDEGPRKGQTMEVLAKLKPAFKKDGGTVTAANASGINDGAAAVVVMSADKAKELGLKPMVTIRGYASAGCEPELMGTGPIYATRKVMKKLDLTVDDFDLIEANEAFAAQFLAVGNTLGFKKEKVNIHGGAVALGHPLGCSGARILVTLIYAMEEKNVKRGLATLCIGGGMGMAAVVERP